jgi:energy-coupling factor transporter ATP-binding protein EcfA2
MNVATAKRLTGADIIPNGVVGSDHDRLDHGAIAQVVSDLACSVETPANVALFGPWGSGKSSLYQMVREQIDSKTPGIAMVKYDAWKFGGTMLQRNFLFEVAAQLEISKSKFLSNLDSSTEVARLRLGRFLWRNRWSLLGALGIAILAAVVYVTGMAGVEQVGKSTWRHEARLLIPTGVTVLGLVLAGLLLSNQTLASATEKRSRSPLQDADQFSAAFNNLMREVKKSHVRGAKVSRLVVFIDELDRCKPEDVVSVLISLKTFLDHDDCVFIVAADRDVLREALEEAPQAKPVRENEPYYSTAGAFIDKIFQYQIALPPVRAEALIDFAMELAEQQMGLWDELRQRDRRAYEDVVYALVPAYVQSPRRVKVLMNNFVTTSRAIEARRLDRIPEPAEVAVLTVLQTEFPSLVQDLVHEPRLLDVLMDPALVMDLEANDRLNSLLRAYDPEGSADGDASPAGPLLVDGEGDADKQRGARLKLNQQLDGYLSYIQGAGIPFPRLDLVYLQDAASANGIEDPALRQLLDVAHVHAPNTLIEDFLNASASDKKAAIQFLATKANTTFGPARANLIELACRITELLNDMTDIASVAPFVTPTVMGEARGDRWRSSATPGALLLGLLDPQNGGPLDQLGEHASASALAEQGVFARITPTLERISDERALPVHHLLLGAYREHPEPLHDALRDLSTKAAERLWHDVSDGITSLINRMPTEPPQPVAPTPNARGVATTPEWVEPESDLAQDRYEDLLIALSAREAPASDLGFGALVIGIEGAADLYAKAHLYADDLIGNVVADPSRCNDLALAALAAAPDADLGDWAEVLNPDATATESTAEAARDRLHQDLTRRSQDELADIVTVYRRLIPWLTDDSAATSAEALAAILADTPFVETAAPSFPRRRAIFDLLDALTPLISHSAVDQIRLADIERALSASTTIEPVITELVAQIRLLPTAEAATMDARLGEIQKTSEEPLLVARLRVHARERASKKALPINAFAADLSDDAASAALISDWFTTNPPLKDAQVAIEKSTVGQNSLAVYAERRSMTDRSKLWITASDASYSTGHLRAIGKFGVNATVIEHVHSDLLAADLATQRTLAARLLTADLSHETGARKSASVLAIALLKSGRVGSGASAASLVLNAGGAGTNMTNPLRKAFDKFTSKNPNALNRGVVRELNDLNLLTRKKSNPVSTFLNWFTSDDD